MSIYTDVDVTIECDKCYKDINESWDKVYCSGCAGVHDDEHFDTVHAQAVELVDDWLFDNRLILSSGQQKFMELMLESLQKNRMPDIQQLRA